VLFHVFSMPMNGFFCKSPYFSPFSEAVPKVYMEHTNKKDLQVGDLYPLSLEYVQAVTTALVAIANVLDHQFVPHFKLM